MHLINLPFAIRNFTVTRTVTAGEAVTVTVPEKRHIYGNVLPKKK